MSIRYLNQIELLEGHISRLADDGAEQWHIIAFFEGTAEDLQTLLSIGTSSPPSPPTAGVAIEMIHFSFGESKTMLSAFARYTFDEGGPAHLMLFGPRPGHSGIHLVGSCTHEQPNFTPSEHEGTFHP